jgi:hypothetical protein
VTILILAVLVGLFAGIAVHQRVILREANFALSSYQDAEVRSAELIGNLKAQVRAHETSLVMIMREVGR